MANKDRTDYINRRPFDQWPMIFAILILVIPELMLLPAARAEEDIVSSEVWGNLSYTQYIPGNCSVIITVAHGGGKRPERVSTRSRYNCYNETTTICDYHPKCDGEKSKTHCKSVVINDAYTIRVSTDMHKAFGSLGCWPHRIIMHLAREKVDANRPLERACQTDPVCWIAYANFHGFIRTARGQIRGPGLLIDVHGQSHSARWIELGYAITKSDINNNSISIDKLPCSIAMARNRSRLTNEEIVRGNWSLGALLSARGYRIVPSPVIPRPGDDGYYAGGFITQTYGSLVSDMGTESDGSMVDAIQVELDFNTRKYNRQFGEDFANATLEWMAKLGYFNLVASGAQSTSGFLSAGHWEGFLLTTGLLSVLPFFIKL